jgi:type IV pilus assembly protein PilN
MIRVNLLPVRELQAAVSRRRDLTIGGIVLGSVLTVLLATYLLQHYRLSKLASEQELLRREIQDLNVKVKEVGDLQIRINEYTSKHNVISDLNKKKTGPVGIMESLSTATPARLWLTEFKETGGRLTINGTAADNQTVAEFLKALAASAYFSDVELVETTQGGQESGPLKKFSIRSGVSYLPAPTPQGKGEGVKDSAKEGAKG